MSTEAIAAPNPVTVLRSIQPIDIAPDVRSADAAQKMVELMVVTSQEDYDLAAFELGSINTKLAALEAKRETVSVPLNTALRAFNALFTGPREALEAAKTSIKAKMLTWKQGEDRKAAQIAADAALVVETERKRLAAEAEAIAATARAECAAATNEVEFEKIADAAAEKIASLNAVAEVITAPPAVANFRRAAGTSTSKKWVGEMTDKLALIRHVAANGEAEPELLDLFELVGAKLRARVAASGQHLKLPGVKVREQESISSRAA